MCIATRCAGQLRSLLCPHTDRHAGDILFTVSFFLSLSGNFFVTDISQRGLTQGYEIWQLEELGSRSFIWVNFGLGVSL